MGKRPEDSYRIAVSVVRSDRTARALRLDEARETRIRLIGDASTRFRVVYHAVI